MFSRLELEHALSSFESLPGGNEHLVYYDAHINLVVKITVPPNYGARGAPLNYLKNLITCNSAVASGFKLIGVAENFRHDSSIDESLVFIISQPFVEGVKASVSEIEQFLQLFDIHPISNRPNSFRSSDKSMSLWDVRPDNVIKDEAGTLHFIDIHIDE